MTESVNELAQKIEKLLNEKAEKALALREQQPITVDEVKDFVYGMDENIKGSHQAFRYAVVFTAGLHLDHDVKTLCEFTGYSYNIVSKAKQNLEKNKVWINNKVSCEYLFDENTDPLLRMVEFWLCVSIAEGKVVRVKEDAEDIQTQIEKAETVGDVKFSIGVMVMSNKELKNI